MKMIIKIKIENQAAEVVLISGQKKIDREPIVNFNNISEELLPAIDRILKRNKITLANIKKIDSEIDLPESYTAARIVEATIKGLNLRIKK